MAKGKKTGGRNFPKGVSGNPDGRPVLPPIVKQFRRLTKEIVEDVGSIILEANESALFEIVHDPNSSALKKWIASAALNGMQIGDMDSLDKLLNRIIGKASEKKDVTDALSDLSDEDKIKALEDALAFMRAKATSK